MTVWDGGDHEFRLGIGELRALQQETGVGPLFLLGRIAGSQWFVDDIYETVRLGLIGGGTPQDAAKRLVDKVFVDDTPKLYKHSLLALKILKEAVMGPVDDPVDGDDEGESKAGNSNS